MTTISTIAALIAALVPLLVAFLNARGKAQEAAMVEAIAEALVQKKRAELETNYAEEVVNSPSTKSTVIERMRSQARS